MKEEQKYSWEERDLAIELWRESGLSQTGFCKREGIARSTFQHWMERSQGKKRHQVKKKSGSIVAGKFIPLTVNASTTEREEISSSSTLELIYPNGVRLKLSPSVSTLELQQYIHLI